eukprot:916302_1
MSKKNKRKKKRKIHQDLVTTSTPGPHVQAHLGDLADSTPPSTSSLPSGGNIDLPTLLRRVQRLEKKAMRQDTLINSLKQKLEHAHNAVDRETKHVRYLMNCVGFLHSQLNIEPSVPRPATLGKWSKTYCKPVVKSSSQASVSSDQQASVPSEKANVPRQQASLSNQQSSVPIGKACLPNEHASVFNKTVGVSGQQAGSSQQSMAVAIEDVSVSSQKASVSSQQASVSSQQASVSSQETSVSSQKSSIFNPTVGISG